MSAPPSTPANDPAHWARSVMERQVAILGELAEDGLAITKSLKAEVTDAEARPAEDIERLTRAWSRAARAVRLSLMLQARLITDIDALARAAASGADLAVRKGRVQAIVRRIAEHQRPAARERLERGAAERLEADFSGDILARPISELVELICRDLDLQPPWPALAQEPWALEELHSERPGWPLMAVKEGQDIDASRHDQSWRRATSLSP